MKRDDTCIIGVTGHRDITPWAIAPIKEKIRQAFQDILELRGGKKIYVMSSLADGADRLVYEHIKELRPDTGLIYAAPMPPAEYAKDFTPESLSHFETLRQSASKTIDLAGPEDFDISGRDACYHAASGYVCQNSDFLIALWDYNKSKVDSGTLIALNFWFRHKRNSKHAKAYIISCPRVINTEMGYENPSSIYMRNDID